MTKTRALLIGCALAFVVHMLWIYLPLPATVATHFDGAGNPNGWMTKGTFLIFETVLLAFIVGEMLLVPRMIGRMPKSLINLPNKDYWLSDEHREETFSTFRSYFDVFGSGLLLLVLVVNHLVYVANVNRQNLTQNIWLVIIAFVSFVVIWLAKLILEFRIKK